MLAARALRENGAPEKTRLWAMMETPNAILNAGSIAATAADPTSRLEVLVMGLNDLAKETRARLTPGRPTMTAWLAICVVAARAHGFDIIDGVYNDIKDLEGFRAECEQGREMGLDGKTLIHPSQIDICNEVFAPTAAEVDSARAIIDAFALPENAGKGVIQLNGKMVELLHADMAEPHARHRRRASRRWPDRPPCSRRARQAYADVSVERSGRMSAEHHSLFQLGPGRDALPQADLRGRAGREGARAAKSWSSSRRRCRRSPSRR